MQLSELAVPTADFSHKTKPVKHLNDHARKAAVKAQFGFVMSRFAPTSAAIEERKTFSQAFLTDLDLAQAEGAGAAAAPAFVQLLGA